MLELLFSMALTIPAMSAAGDDAAGMAGEVDVEVTVTGVGFTGASSAFDEVAEGVAEAVSVEDAEVVVAEESAEEEGDAVGDAVAGASPAAAVVVAAGDAAASDVVADGEALASEAVADAEALASVADGEGEAPASVPVGVAPSPAAAGFSSSWRFT